MPKVVTNMLDAKAELDGRLRGVIGEFVEGFAGRMLAPLHPTEKGKGGKMASEFALADAQEATADVRTTIQKDVPFLRKKLEEYLRDPRTKETLVAAVMDKVTEGYEDWYEEWARGPAAQSAGRGGKKGKGREDEVWGPPAFADWAAGVFDVGRLGFLDDEDGGGGSRRGSEVGSI